MAPFMLTRGLRRPNSVVCPQPAAGHRLGLSFFLETFSFFVFYGQLFLGGLPTTLVALSQSSLLDFSRLLVSGVGVLTLSWVRY